MEIGEEIIIGRMGNQPMPIYDSTVAVQHALLRKTAEEVYQIESLTAANGISVYGMRIKRKTVNEDTPIMLGTFNITVRYLLQDPAEIDLSAIWDEYDAEKRRWDRKTIMVNYLRVVPTILTMALGLFVGPETDRLKRGLITLTLTVVVLVISMWATEKIMARKNNRITELNAEMQNKYRCPHCHRPLPIKPYRILKQNICCPLSGCGHPLP